MKEIITLQSEKTMFFKRKRVAAYARVSTDYRNRVQERVQSCCGNGKN